MSSAADPIRITRGRGGQVEVEGVVDHLARDVLRRAGFLFEPSLDGQWIRLPFDMGRDWENQHATWAGQMLSAARYPVRLDPDLRPDAPTTAAPAGPASPPALTMPPPPGRLPRH